MAETRMNVQLIAHTQLSGFFHESEDLFYEWAGNATDGQAVALTAIRSCYSANKPTEIVAKEGAKYFGSKASDGGEGTDADRLFRHIVRSGHSSTLEHISFTFAIEGVSRALLAQLTRHRVGFSFSVQSQRYVRMGSDDKIGGFDYVLPDKVKTCTKELDLFGGGDALFNAREIFENALRDIQDAYDHLREMGVPAEDATFGSFKSPTGGII